MVETVDLAVPAEPLERYVRAYIALTETPMRADLDPAPSANLRGG